MAAAAAAAAAYTRNKPGGGGTVSSFQTRVAPADVVLVVLRFEATCVPGATSEGSVATMTEVSEHSHWGQNQILCEQTVALGTFWFCWAPT